jgi:hypothetical protein
VKLHLRIDSIIVIQKRVAAAMQLGANELGGAKDVGAANKLGVAN